MYKFLRVIAGICFSVALGAWIFIPVVTARVVFGQISLPEVSLADFVAIFGLLGIFFAIVGAVFLSHSSKFHPRLPLKY